jgi:hypothetical protein
VVAPIGSGKPGQACVRIALEAGGAARVERSVPFGELVVVPLAEGHSKLTATPERGFDLGAGKGKSIEATVHGGVVGLIVDTRGRQPFMLAGDRAARIAQRAAWNRALGMYPEGA